MQERDAARILDERVRDYELYISPVFSAVGDPARREDPAYHGHLANDGATCAADAGGEDDAAEMLRLFDAVLGSFDRLFSSIGSAERKGGAERLRAGAAAPSRM